MKVRVVSDVHMDMLNGPTREKRLRKICDRESSAEVLIVAGDLCEAREETLYRRLIKEFTSSFKYVLMVPGNHEYYGSSIEATNSFLAQLEIDYPTFINLNNYDESIEINGIPFIGATLWFDGESPDAILNKGYLNDYIQIKDFSAKIPQLGKTGKNKLVAGIIEGTSVVVTHHAPLLECASRSVYRDQVQTRAFYVNDCQKIIAQKKPRAWFHGHMHVPNVFVPAFSTNTLVLSNPLGYQFESTGGNPRLTITLS